MAGRLALLLAGAWLGALVLSWFVATTNFRVVDRVLASPVRPEIEERLASVPVGARREVLRHLASEVNRALFRGFGLAQLAIGLAVVGLVWAVAGRARILVVLAFGIVLIQIVLGREIASLGRAIDFVPRPLAPDVGRRFGLLHAAFVLLDFAKAGLLTAVAAILARR
jgi:hypothetical protein